MATTPLLLVAELERGAVLNGYRYMLNRKRNDRVYYKCVLHKDGCKARITVENRQLVSSIPENSTHYIQHSETHTHAAKQSLKWKAEETDLSTNTL